MERADGAARAIRPVAAGATSTRGNLSYGDQRKLEVALSMAGRPRLLLLDEPMAGLSPAESESMQRAARASSIRSIAVLLIEHDMDIAFAFAERVTVLHQGRVLAEGTRTRSARTARVQEIYLGTSVADGCRVRARFSMLDVADVHTYYGDSHVLQGVTLRAEQRHGHGGARPQRRGQDHAVPIARRADAGARAGASSSTASTSRACRRTGSARRGISLVPQGRRIFSSLTVHENLAIAARAPRSRRQRWNLERVFALFPRLAERRHHRGNELSGGEQQMLAIARALVANPVAAHHGRADRRAGAGAGRRGRPPDSAAEATKARRSCSSSRTPPSP